MLGLLNTAAVRKKKPVTHNKKVSGTRHQTPSWTRSHDPQQALHQKNTAGGFNPLRYFNKFRKQSRNSHQCMRTPATARYYCLSGFRLREPELAGGPRVSTSTSLAVSVWHFCQPPSQRETHFAPSAGSAQFAGSAIPLIALPTFLLHSKRTVCMKAGDSSYFRPVRLSTVAAESLHVLPDTYFHMAKACGGQSTEGCAQWWKHAHLRSRFLHRKISAEMSHCQGI